MKITVMRVLASLLTEKLVKALVIHLLKFLAKKTDNDLDDKIVQEIEKALK